MAASDLDRQHEDHVIGRGTILYTLSYDLNRTSTATMFYAVYRSEDLQLYLTMLNGPILQGLFDGAPTDLSAPPSQKYEIKNLTSRDVLVACEDSAARIFAELVATDGDFRDFVVNPARMQAHFNPIKYFFRGYRAARASLRRLRATPGDASPADLARTYRMFNFVIPSDGAGDPERARDIATQRETFFAAMRAAGYSATLDTNDALYGGFHASAPLIVFDRDAIVPQEARETTDAKKDLSVLLSTAARMVGLHR